jgi:hypothetical protein
MSKTPIGMGRHSDFRWPAFRAVAGSPCDLLSVRAGMSLRNELPYESQGLRYLKARDSLP